MNNEFKNYYKILGVTQNASSASIENAARRELEYANPRQSDLIREAASVLLNKESRRRYDNIYNEVVTPVERLRQNAMTESDFTAISALDNRINELEEIIENSTPAEEGPAEEGPTEEGPTEEGPTEEGPTEEGPTEEGPTEEGPTEEGPTEEGPTEEGPTEEGPTEEGPTEEGPTEEEIELKDILDDETLAKEAQIKAFNKKRIRNNALIIGGSTVLFGPLGTLISTLILKKKGKLKLQKLGTKGRIKDIKTRESAEIDAVMKKLEIEIDSLLNSPLKDNQSRYKLELAKLRYQNQVDLLQARINFKKAEKSKLGGKAYNRLYVLALETRLNIAIKALEIRKKKAQAKLNSLNSYNPNKNRMDRLSELYKEINDVKIELAGSDLSEAERNRKKVKINQLNSKKLQKINKMSLKKNGISRRQVVLAMFNSVKNKITNLFPSKDEKTEEESTLGRSR